MANNGNDVPTYTIEVGSAGTFTNEPSVDISTTLNAEISAAPVGDQIEIIFNPGVYGVIKPILLPSNTTVIGNNSTLKPLIASGWSGNSGLLVNKDAYDLGSTLYLNNDDGTVTTISGSSGSSGSTDTMVPGSTNAIIDSNISVQGMTFNDTGQWIFGTWFTNAQNVDVQNNTYIGGPDANAFVDVKDGVVANNIAVGQVNAAYDNWSGPTNISIEDNATYISGTSMSGWSVLINACPSGNLANPGNAVNDAVVGNVFSGYWINGSSGNADPLESYGFTTESSITQQGNVISSLGVPGAGSYYSANVISNSVIQDDTFTGINFSSSDPGSVISAQSSSAAPETNSQISGNLLVGAVGGSSTTNFIFNQSDDPTTSNNAVVGGSGSFNITNDPTSGTSSLSGNISVSGTSIGGSGVISTLDIYAPPTEFISPGGMIDLLDVSIQDPSASDFLSVTVSAVFGALLLSSEFASGVVPQTVSGEQQLIFSGTASQVNVELQSVSYVGDTAGWDDSVEINASNSEGVSTVRYISVLMQPTSVSANELTILPAGYMGSLSASGSTISSGSVVPLPSLNGEIAIASSGNNLIEMGSTISVAFLGSGFDTVVGGSGQEYIAAGNGDAEINLLGDGDVTVAGGSGTMSVQAVSGNDLIEVGSSTADILTGASADTIVGGLGSSSITGGTGPLFITTLPQDGGWLHVELGAGNATVLALSGNSSISSRPGTSNLFALGIGSNFVQSAGYDTISTGAGSNTIDASSGGDDQVTGGTGAVVFKAGTLGFSSIFAGSGNLTVTSSSANVDLYITAISSASRTISLSGLSAGVSLVGSLSIVSETFGGQAIQLLLSDGTVVQIDDSMAEFIGDQGGRLSLVPNTEIVATRSFTSLYASLPNEATWSIFGASSGYDTINTSGSNTLISTSGGQNLVGLSGEAATVSSGGQGDLIVGYGGANVISVDGAGSAVIVEGSNDTVYASPGCASLNVFFSGQTTGQLCFINQSVNPESVTGGANGSGGSVTVYAGMGGGYFEGGSSGNNYLVGGSGASATTLIGAGVTSFLSVGGSGANALFAGDGNATLIAGLGTTSNLFQGGAGTDVLSSQGSGIQSFFPGSSGSETITGSTVQGASNVYFFDQSSNVGGGADVIENFNMSRDSIFIIPSNMSPGGVTIQEVQTAGSDSFVFLSNNTEIKLLGVTLTNAQQAGIVGSTSL